MKIASDSLHVKEQADSTTHDFTAVTEGSRRFIPGLLRDVSPELRRTTRMRDSQKPQMPVCTMAAR